MIKKALRLFAGVAAMLTVAGNAYATTADVEVNMFGASAQYETVKNIACTHLSNLGCQAADIFIAEKTGLDARDSMIAWCRGSAGKNPLTMPAPGAGQGKGTDGLGKTYALRYSTRSSFEGCRSVQGLSPSEDVALCADLDERYMADEDTTTWGTCGAIGTVTANKCIDVTVGVSDVSCDTFQQQSNGYRLGPDLDASSGVGKTWDSLNVGPIPVGSGIGNFRPIVVVFSLWANTYPGPDGLDNNTDDEEVPFNSLTRLQAIHVLGGAVPLWTLYQPDLDGDGTPFEYDYYQQDGTKGDLMHVTVCHRHAGSGTVATLKAGLFRDQSLPTNSRHCIGGDLNTCQNVNGLQGCDDNVCQGASSAIFFNLGSSDMVRCVGGVKAGVATWSTVTGGGPGTCDFGAVGRACIGAESKQKYLGIGAIGYADVDKEKSLTITADAPYGKKTSKNVKLVALGGQPTTAAAASSPTAWKDSVRRGQYPPFWTNQWFFYNTGEPAGVLAAIQDLNTKLSTPSLLPPAVANYWPTTQEMYVTKATDFSYPTYTGVPVYP